MLGVVTGNHLEGWFCHHRACRYLWFMKPVFGGNSMKMPMPN